MKTRNLSINLPVPSLDLDEVIRSNSERLSNFLEKISLSFSNTLHSIGSFFSRITGFTRRLSLRKKVHETESLQEDNSKPRFNIKNLLRFFAVVIVAIVILIAGASLFNNQKKSSSDVDTTVQEAKATQDIYKDFDFPLRDSNDEILGNIKYTVEKAELRDEIVVKGQKATAIDGRTFLIVYLKLKNELDKTIKMNTKDYIRLSVNGNTDEWLAPDIHNDPVEIQAISTKYTRLGFPINDSDGDLLLRVGEIEGEKQEIPLNLK